MTFLAWTVHSVLLRNEFFPSSDFSASSCGKISPKSEQGKFTVGEVSKFVVFYN